MQATGLTGDTVTESPFIRTAAGNLLQFTVCSPGASTVQSHRLVKSRQTSHRKQQIHPFHTKPDKNTLQEQTVSEHSTTMTRLKMISATGAFTVNAVHSV